jgi:hypothetical protein
MTAVTTCWRQRDKFHASAFSGSCYGCMVLRLHIPKVADALTLIIGILGAGTVANTQAVAKSNTCTSTCHTCVWWLCCITAKHDPPAYPSQPIVEGVSCRWEMQFLCLTCCCLRGCSVSCCALVLRKTSGLPSQSSHAGTPSGRSMFASSPSSFFQGRAA